MLNFAVGCNIEDGPQGMDPLYNQITAAVNKGLINVTTLRESVKPLFYTRMRLGLFDPATNNPFAQLDPKTIVQSAEHRQIAVEAAMKTFVLLKNSNNVLPIALGKIFNKIAVSLKLN